MAKCATYTCDLCGDLYDGGKFASGVFQNDTYSSHISITDYGTYGDGEKMKYKSYELCPCCMTRVRNYINNLIEEKKYKVVSTPIETSTIKRPWYRRR